MHPGNGTYFSCGGVASRKAAGVVGSGAGSPLAASGALARAKSGSSSAGKGCGPRPSFMSDLASGRPVAREAVVRLIVQHGGSGAHVPAPVRVSLEVTLADKRLLDFRHAARLQVEPRQTLPAGEGAAPPASRLGPAHGGGFLRGGCAGSEGRRLFHSGCSGCAGHRIFCCGGCSRAMCRRGGLLGKRLPRGFRSRGLGGVQGGRGQAGACQQHHQKAASLVTAKVQPAPSSILFP